VALSGHAAGGDDDDDGPCWKTRVHGDDDDDVARAKLPALEFYRLAIPAH
jgi:hypothetical protein